MKKRLERLDEREVSSRFPIADRVPGWYFGVVEVSAGVWEVTGTDLEGRRVSATGSDVDELLGRCSEDARGLGRVEERQGTETTGGDG